MDKKALSEEDIKLQYITPAITETAGWDRKLIRMEYYYTAGRVVFAGKQHTHAEGKKVDYLLFADKANNYPIAVVEAKDNNKSVGQGMQQAIGYARDLDVRFAYSSNGDAFLEHDLKTGKETELSLDKFPTLEMLLNRIQYDKHYTKEQRKIIDQPYFFDTIKRMKPRYYQTIAINRTIEAIARGKQRILLVMATGTGKTFTAFQILWRLFQSGTKKKILYIADRNILIDQTMTQDFKPFQKIMTKIGSEKDSEGKTIVDSAYSIYMSLYQQLVSNDPEVPDPFTQVSPDFFDLVVIDECHRGSVRDDSDWKKILTYFSSATQIGMTATPKSQEGADNLDYFGEPVYTYSLRQGILDGFLAPYRITRSFINIDLDGWTPEKGEQDIYGKLIEVKKYEQNDYGRDLRIKLRRQVVARRITEMLHDIGRMTKTIVFCTDINEAEAMRQLLVNLNQDLVAKDPRYVMRITGDDNEGKKQLENFITPASPYPTVVTTSELLSTGVDCKTCGLIVIDKEIGSMTEFKQIIGRGTRLKEDYGKFHFEILDFRNATTKFLDPEFDGEEIPHEDKRAYKKPGRGEGGDGVHEHDTYTIEGKDIKVVNEMVSYTGADGRPVKENYIDYTKQSIRGKYATLNDFIERWSEADRKEAIVNELKDYNFLIDHVRETHPELAKADIFDIVCYLAYDCKPKMRSERAKKVIDSGYLSQFSNVAREVLEKLLQKYADDGILELEDKRVLMTPPFQKFGMPPKIIKAFGGKEKYEEALRGLEKELYKDTV